MRRAVLLLLAVGALLQTPAAAGVADVPGDPTPPVVTPVILGTLGLQGWYLTNVTLSWSIVDPESIILETNGCDIRTFTADTSGTTRTCSATSDGGTTTVSKTIKLDKTAPAASANPARAADLNGWYNHALPVGFSGSDATSGLDSCTATQTYAGPDGATASVAGSCRDVAGNVTGRSLAFAYDATAPVVRPVPQRAADANGWYNRPLTVAFSGSDATSGLASCSSVPYAGPDNPGAAVSGTCVDRAGNASVVPFGFKYDATPPVVRSVRARPRDRRMELTWDVSPDVRVVEVTRSPGVRDAASTLIYRGPAGRHRDVRLRVARKYRYTVAAYDEAANRAARSMVVTATGPLLKPAPGEPVTAPPRLVWEPVNGATYYNVQLMRERRVLSAWPTRTSLQLKRTWVSKGRRHRLTPGVYRWYVWPGLGRVSEGRYGPRIGGSSFVVVK
jgi:hypothetical protein